MVQSEPTAKRIRGRIGDHTVVDSTNVQLVWEFPFYPQYFVPADDVAATFTKSDAMPDQIPPFDDDLGEPVYLDVTVAQPSTADGPDHSVGTVVPAGAWHYPSAPAALRHLVRFAWSTMDTWLEEDVEVIVHPRSPYVRVDALASSRHVRVEIDGVVVAESDRPTFLFETGLRTRTYLPVDDVRMDLLEPSPTVTQCPYKGTATYYSARVDGRVHDDVVWTYVDPLPESAAVAGLLCFYDERVSNLVVT